MLWQEDYDLERLLESKYMRSMGYFGMSSRRPGNTDHFTIAWNFRVGNIRVVNSGGNPPTSVFTFAASERSLTTSRFRYIPHITSRNMFQLHLAEVADRTDIEVNRPILLSIPGPRGRVYPVPVAERSLDDPKFRLGQLLREFKDRVDAHRRLGSKSSDLA